MLPLKQLSTFQKLFLGLFGTFIVIFTISAYTFVGNLQKGSAVKNIDLNDPATVLAIKSILVSGLDPGTLTLDKQGKLVTKVVQVTGEKGEDGEPGQQGERGLQGLSGLNGTSDGWKKQNGVVSLAEASDLVGLGTDNPHFKLQVNGDIGPGTDDQNSLGSETARWQSVNVGTGGVKLVNSYIDASNNETGGLSYAEYTVPLPGASTVLLFNNEENFTQQELKNNATTYTSSGADITTNAQISANVQVGCRVALDSNWYTISDYIDQTHFTVDQLPASSGTLNHVYCTSFNGGKLQLNSHTVTGPGDLNSFNMVTLDPDAATVHDTWTKPIVYASKINKYVTAGYDYTNIYGSWNYHATMYVSTDLQTWTKQVLDTSTADTEIRNMIYEPVSGKIVAAGFDSTSGDESYVVWESTDAVAWTKHVVKDTGSDWDGPQMIVYDNSASRYVFGALYYDGGLGQYRLSAWESTDLVSWTEHVVKDYNSYPNVTAFIHAENAGKFVFGGYDSPTGTRVATIWESSDLVTWNEVQVETTYSRFTAMTYDPDHGKYIGVGWYTGWNTAGVWESTDLVNWTHHSVSDYGCAPTSILYNPESQKYIIGGEGRDQDYNWRSGIWYSSDLTNWTDVYVTPTDIDGKTLGLNYDPVNGRFIAAGMVWGNNYDQATVWYTDAGTMYSYPTNKPYIAVTTNASELDTSHWLAINGISVTQQLNNQQTYYSFSFDGRNTWKILQTGQIAWRTITRNDNGTWQYNAASSYSDTVWTDSPHNTLENALFWAMTVSGNQMNAANLVTFSDSDYAKAGGFTAKNPTLNIATGLLTTQSTRSPNVSSILFNYENSFSDNAVTISSKATGTGSSHPIQMQVGSHDKAFFLDANGNVGIGTNAPRGIFDINSLLVVKDSGLVGIGTDSPNYKLDVNGDFHATEATIDGLMTSGSGSILGDLSVHGILNPGNSLLIGGDVTLNQGLSVTNDAVFNSNILLNNKFSISTEGIATLSKYQGYSINISKPGTFANHVDYSSMWHNNDIATGNFNADGHIDIATVMSEWGYVAIFFNQGNGIMNFWSFFSVGNQPNSLTVGDINGDGKSDIVTTNGGYSYSVTVLTNTGNGGFSRQDYSIGDIPQSVAIADVNGDNKPDLVTNGYNSGQVFVLLNNGSGSFTTPIGYAVGSYPYKITVADFNNDTHADIVSVNTYDASVLFNNGDGTFASKVDCTTGYGFTAIDNGDIDKDGDIDFVVANYNSNNVLLFVNNGNGTFTTGSSYSVGQYPDSVKLTDLNNDGSLDMAVANWSADTVSVLFNNGSGNFISKVDYATAHQPASVAVADFNGDNTKDLATGNYWGNNISVLLNQSQSLLFTDSATGNVGIGTTNPSYKLDVQGGQINASDGICIAGVCNAAWGYSYVSGNIGIGTATPGYKLDVQGGQLNVSGGLCIAGDCRTMWDPRVVYPYIIRNNIPVFTNGLSIGDGLATFASNGNIKGIGSYQGGEMLLTKAGTLAAKTDYSVANNPFAIASGDVTGDGKADLVTANYNAYSISVLKNTGNGTFTIDGSYTSSNNANISLSLGDFNGDNKLDVAMISNNANQLAILLNNGSGSFTLARSYATASVAWGVTTGDLNGDGKTDIVVTNNNAVSVSVYMGNGDGTFATRVDYSTDGGPREVVIDDFNGDGKNDIAVTCVSPGTMAILMNNGNGTFATKVSYTAGTVTHSIASGDLNGDSRPDIVVTNYTANTISVFMNNGNGTFASKVDYSTGVYPAGVKIGDMTGDGKPDVIVVDNSSNQLQLFANQGTGTLGTPTNYATVGGSTGLTIGDYNGDGKYDVAYTAAMQNTVSVNLNQGTTMFYAQASTGRVGIGTTTPGYALDVQGGQINASGGVCIAGNCMTSIPTGAYQFTTIQSGLSQTSLGINLRNTSGVYADGGSIKGFSSYQGGQMSLVKAGTFAAKVDYTTANSPYLLAVGDINNDGYSDLIIPSYSASNVVSVLKNNGDGTFSVKVDYVTGSTPYSAKTVDVNGDGKLDILVTNFGSNTFSVLMNNGDGTFAAKVDYATGTNPIGIAVGDINGDGYIDAAVANCNSNAISVYMNNGNGTFATKVDYSSGNSTTSIDIGDITGDGKNDIVSASNGYTYFSVYKNQGNGTFASKVDYTAGTSPRSIVIADINGDRMNDIITGNNSSSDVSVSKNLGNGTFSSSVNYPIATAVSSVSVKDLNNDGLPDIIAGNQNISFVSVLLNTGADSFAAKVNYATNGGVSGVATGDFNNDGGIDIAAATNSSPGTVSVLLNKTSSMFYAQASTGNIGIGTTTPGYKLDVQGRINATQGFSVGGDMLVSRGGTFAAKVDYSTVSSTYAATIGDFNGDGSADFAVLNSGVALLSVFINNGNGTFATKVDYATGNNPVRIVSGDVNGDGKLDLLVTNYGSTFSVLINNGNGTFAAKVDYPTNSLPWGIAVGDINGDNYSDVVITAQMSGYVSVYLNNGNGTFATRVEYQNNGVSASTILADVNGDGKLDIITGNQGANTVSVFKNNGNGTFATRVEYATNDRPITIAVDDINGDGVKDIVAVCQNSNVISVLKNNGKGTFSTKVDYPVGAYPGSVVIADVDKKSFNDIIVGNNNSSTFSVLNNNGDGTFSAKVDYPTGGYTVGSIATGDLNNDSYPDVVVPYESGTVVSVYMNQASTLFYAQSSTGFVGINTSTPAVNLDVAGAFRVAGNMTVNNTSMATGTLDVAPSTGTCTGQTNSTTQAVFQSTATLTNAHIFYNSTRTKHSRITSVATCTDGSSNQYRILTLTDAITGSTTGDSYTVYNPLSDIGNASNGFFNNIYAINFKGLTSTLTGGFDLAEQYEATDDTIKEGDVVSIATNQQNVLTQEIKVEKATAESDSKVLGVVSTNPGLTFGDEKEGNWVRVALAGRVPVHVSTVNGAISAGDFLTSSSIPGAAVKAIKPGMVIGRALQDLVCAEGSDFCEGTVMMVVNTTWYGGIGGEVAQPVPTATPAPTVTPEITQIADLAQSGTAMIKTGDQQITITYASPYTKTPILTVTSKNSGVAYDIIDETETGFTIKLKAINTENVSFVWIAFSALSSQSAVSSQ